MDSDLSVAPRCLVCGLAIAVTNSAALRFGAIAEVAGSSPHSGMPVRFHLSCAPRLAHQILDVSLSGEDASIKTGALAFTGQRGVAALLTPREAQILVLMAAGKTNGEIGHALGMTMKTVKNRLSEIYSKMQVSSRTEAAMMAMRWGLLSFEEDPSGMDEGFS